MYVHSLSFMYVANILSQCVSYFLTLFMMSLLYKSFSFWFGRICQSLLILLLDFVTCLETPSSAQNIKICSSVGVVSGWLLFPYCCVWVLSILCLVWGRGLPLFLKYVNSCFEIVCWLFHPFPHWFKIACVMDLYRFCHII